MLIVPLASTDTRFLGRSLRARHQRVAERVGAVLIDASRLPSARGDLAVLVPKDMAINAWLFDDPSFTATIERLRRRDGAGGPVWLESRADAAVLVGRVVDVQPFATDLTRTARPERITVAEDAIVNVGTTRARRIAEWRILQRTAKATDGWVSRHVNRPISRLVSYVMLLCGFTAGHASVMTLGVGIGAALAAARPGYWPLVFTGLLFQLASVLDGVDGEMARATLTESESGARLDTIVDQITYVTCFLGVTTGWVREGGGRAPLVWTICVGAGLLFSLARAARFVARHAENASFVFIDRTVRRAARDTGLTTLQLAAAAFTLLRRDVFAVVFFLVSLTGLRWLIPALVVFGIVVANLTFSGHRRELADAARAERLPAA